MDSSLLQQIYLKYKNEIYLYLYTLCKDRTQAEDLLQETFLKAILSLPNAHANVRAWLYMVARNLFLNDRKKNQASEELNEAVRDTAPGTDEAVIARMTNKALYDALLRLDRVKREVILLQYCSGLPQKEIATILHLSPENVRVLSCRARKELKKTMEEYGYDISR